MDFDFLWGGGDFVEGMKQHNTLFPLSLSLLHAALADTQL